MMLSHTASLSLAIALSILTLAALAHRDKDKDKEMLGSQQLYSAEAANPYLEGCVPHRSGIYLAVTSIGEGFPRIQYTCLSAHHPHPTTQSSTYNNVHDYQRRQSVKGQQAGIASHIDSPADPVPEPIPLPPPHLLHRPNKESGLDRAQKSSHDRIPAYHHLSDQGFVFSPPERAHIETETHTTTLTFSEDTRPLTRPIQVSNRDHDYTKKLRAELSLSEPIKPEPIATMLTPTSLTCLAVEHEPSRCHEASYGHEQKVEPPPPIPEPMPAQSAGSNMESRHQHHKQEQQPQQNFQQSDENHGEESSKHAHKHQKLEPRFGRTIVHRITTLIIETETIIAPPHPTKSIPIHGDERRRRHSDDKKHDPRIEDHVMFDAGIEGDAIVSRASSEHIFPRHYPHKKGTKTTKDEL
ncbi:hypothetical protein BG011_003595 [Mortierella polycephala]|uniref:Uncharacterized protein n=1 Tax=Mortierella polycephala TaxID=41804 RepID=A0A9P6Q3Q7_9FUNG|nr:hypothetical protein BG011_003595 [Mortierella polycephala]